MICEDPDPDTFAPVTSIVSTVLSSDVFLIVIFPVSASTFSLKFRTIFESTATLVASSEGVEELNVGSVFEITKSHLSDDPDANCNVQSYAPKVPDLVELMFDEGISSNTAL